MILRILFIKLGKCRQDLRSSGFAAIGIYIFLVLFFLLRSSTDKKSHNASKIIAMWQSSKNLDNSIVGINEDQKAVLHKLFKRADTTADKKLSLNELAFFIGRQVQHHVQMAMKGNFKQFFALDKMNHNGQVEWDEYYKVYFKGKNLETDRDMKEKLAAIKALWFEAARSNPDALNIDEFLSFTHPESSHSSIAQLTEEKMSHYDENGDDKIDVKEYLADYNFNDFGEDEIDEKRKVFQQIMDLNSDGFVDKRELLQYLDPKAPHWSKKDAQNLMWSMDDNKNNYLEWDECLQHFESLLQSKFASPGKVFHKIINTEF